MRLILVIGGFIHYNTMSLSRHWLVKYVVIGSLVLTMVALSTGVCSAEDKNPENLLGEWKVKKSDCEGNMWWQPTKYSIEKHGENIYIFYSTYRKKETDDSWSLYEKIRPEDPMGRIYTVNNDYYYFEIVLVKAHGITNKARFYLRLQRRGKRLSGTFLRTVSFPVDQIDKAEEALGSNKVLEGTQKWELDSNGVSRQLVDIIVGSCDITFNRIN